MKGWWCARVLALQRRALLLEWLAARVRGCEGAKALVGWALFVDLIEVEERGFAVARDLHISGRSYFLITLLLIILERDTQYCSRCPVEPVPSINSPQRLQNARQRYDTPLSDSQVQLNADILQSAVYGKCIFADYNNVRKDMCVNEFMKLKECYLVRSPHNIRRQHN